MILTSECILENMEKKNIIIEPFNIDQLNPNSYDVRLDNKLQVYTRNEYAFAYEYNDDVLVQQFKQQNYVESSCCCDEQTIYYIDAKKSNATEEIIIPEEGYILVPGVLYLGSTVEYTETHNIVPTIEGKSSIGRLGIDIHKTAGFGDLSFCGTWTLEITVTQPVKIYPYMRLAQIIYHEISGSVGKTYNGKYQGQHGIIASKAHEDFECK